MIDEEMLVRVELRLTPELRTAAKVAAAQAGVTMTAWLTQAVKEKLART